MHIVVGVLCGTREEDMSGCSLGNGFSLESDYLGLLVAASQVIQNVLHIS